MAAIVLLAGTALVSTAFTTAEIDRSADFSVQADGGGIIEFTPGTGDGAQLASNGEIELTLNDLNKNSNFTFGNINDPSATSVFKFKNTDGTDHTFNVGANGVNENMTFYVEDPDNTSFSGFKTFTGNGSISQNFTLEGTDTSAESAAVAIAVSDTGKINNTGTLYINVTGDGDI